ncbi:unnamed protein product [Urochloa humidicola]
MANPWGIPAVGWGVVFMGWLLSPMFSLLWAKLFAYLASDTSRKLRVLEIDTIPSLKKMLRDVEHQRMQRTTKETGSVSDLATLKKIETDLKSALCEAEDILDLLDYYRIERKVLGDRSWVQRLLILAGACITRCKGSWFGKCVESIGPTLLQCAEVVGAAVMCFARRVETIGAAVLQYAKQGSWFGSIGAAALKCAKGVGAVGRWLQSIGASVSNSIGAALRRSSERLRLPIFQRPSNSMLQRLRAWSNSIHLKALCVNMKTWIINTVVQKLHVWSQSLNIKALCRSMQNWLARTYADACYYRDWSYDVVGIKSNQKDDIAVDSFLPVIEGWRLKKKIEQIENIVSDSKKLDLLNKDSSSSENPVDDTNNKESGRTQEEIDDLHRGIKREVFGRDKVRDEICNMLREGSEAYGRKPYFVIGIHGITGSGKSTLAQYVCDHEKAAEEKHFDLIMFSHVSLTFSVDKIFLSMLEQITMKDRPSDARGPKSLQKELKDELRNKRFLLVLDDLWVSNENQKGQDILLDALGTGRNGSVILVTAQREDAAAALGSEKQILLPDLEEKEFLSLLMHHALPGTINDDGEYERIGRKIANKLHRSPIAAVTVGKQLQRNRRISFWESTANDDVLNETMGALWWSYQQLGADIRRCFAYCSTFPRGYRLERDQLVHIWIAQGFVNTRSGATEELEDVGKRYFDELLTFSFLQAQGTTLGTELTWIETFTIHDLLHELAERVARCDFHRIDLDWSPKDIPQGVRHVFIDTSKGPEIAEKYLDLENLRTLIIEENWTDTDRNHDIEKVFENLFMRMRKLRVLVVKLNHKTEAFSVPASIDQMKHLRYFGFKYKLSSEGNRLILPSAISKLYHMQTIKVGSSYCEVSCPEDMSNLIHLRHISGPLFIPNVGRLTSLQTLPRFKVREERGYELKQLNHLNKLRGTLMIDDLGNAGSKEEALEAHLTQKKRLTKLELWFDGCEDRDPDIIAEIFEGLCPPEDLLELAIWDYNCSLRYPSWMLSPQHPDAPRRLQTLVLRWCSPLASIPEDSVLFKGLLELCIQDCNWDSLPENMERLVSLQDLIIDGCRKMEFLPTLPQSLQTLIIRVCDKMELLPTLPQSLQTLIIRMCGKMELLPTLPQSLRGIQIIGCSVLSTTCEEEGHENWHKIQHIPEKIIL